MYKILSHVVMMVLLGIFAFSLQGCDQVKKFTDYLSPRAKTQQKVTSQSAKTSKPIPKKEKMPAKQAAKSSTDTSAELAPGVLAQVGEWTITLDEFNERVEAVKAMAPELDTTDVEQRKLMLSELIQQQLLAQEARSRKIDQKKEFKAAMGDFRNNLLVQLLGTEIGQAEEVTDEEARAFYDENPAFFETLIERKIREIVVQNEDEAKGILVELNQGADFVQTAKTRSIAKSKSKGGDLGFLTVATGDPQLDKSVFPFEKMAQVSSAMDPGSVSGAFKGPEGIYIIKLEETRGGEIQKFDEIQEDLKQYLLVNKQQQILIETLSAAQEKFPVQINEKLLEEQADESGK